MRVIAEPVVSRDVDIGRDEPAHITDSPGRERVGVLHDLAAFSDLGQDVGLYDRAAIDNIAEVVGRSAPQDRGATGGQGVHQSGRQS